MQTVSVGTPQAASLLDQLAKPKQTGKKKDCPSFADTLRPKVLQLLALKRQRKDLEAEIKLLEAELKPSAESALLAFSREGKELLSSIEYNGVKFIRKNQYAAIVDAAVIAAMAELEHSAGVAPQSYAKKAVTVQVDADKLPECLMLDLKALGAEFWFQFLPTTQFHTDMALREDVAGLAASTLPGVKPSMYFSE